MCAAAPLLGVGIDRSVLRGVEEEVRAVGEANGEVVREGVERYWRGSVARSVVGGVGFVLGVVGIWGDGF